MKTYLVRFEPCAAYYKDGCIENTIDVDAESVLDAINRVLDVFLVRRFIFVKLYEEEN